MQEHLFDSRTAASTAAAEAISRLIERRLNGNSKASFVVSGGTTPGECFDALAGFELGWENVSVVLSDERWVPPSSPDSNERLVRERLLTSHAAEAGLLPVYREEGIPGERAEELNGELRSLPFPFACALLGMGEDGHFASLFPDAENLEEGLDIDSQSLFLSVSTGSSPHPRISLTLSALSRSDEIVLLVFGEAKREVLEQARQPNSNLPIASLLRQKRAPVNLYWAL
ncbi:MAG: 6-phosphogluconolactonase [Pseudomonadota bacterium]